MAAGMGNMIADLIGGNPTHDLAQRLDAAQNPNPLQQQQPGQGAPPVPGQGAQQARQAPAAATQPDPTTQSLTEALLRVHQRDQAVQGFNEGLEGMAASFGTAQQQASKRAAMAAGRGQGDDTLRAIQETQGITQNATLQQEHAASRNGAELYGQQVLHLPPGQATELFNSGVWPDVIKSHATPTEQMQNVDAAMREWMAANPKATPEEIAARKSSMLAGLIPGPASTAANAQAKDAQEFKDTATEEYGTVSQKLRMNQDTVDQLLNDIPHTMRALTTPFPTSGIGAAWNPLLSQKTVDQSVLINRLKAELTGESLTNVKNVRNRMEFETLGKSLTAALDPANSPEQVRQALTDLRNKFLDARATAEAAAGHKLTGPLVGHGSRDLLDPKNPYYNGATEEVTRITSPEDISKLPHGTPFIIPSGPHKGETGYAQ